MRRRLREGYLDILHRVIRSLLMGDTSGSDVENQGKGSGKPGDEQRIRFDEA